jgi:hypothetical protein
MVPVDFMAASQMTARDVIAKDLLAAVLGNIDRYTKSIQAIGMDKWLKQRCAECYTAADTLMAARFIKPHHQTNTGDTK